MNVPRPLCTVYLMGRYKQKLFSIILKRNSVIENHLLPFKVSTYRLTTCQHTSSLPAVPSGVPLENKCCVLPNLPLCCTGRCLEGNQVMKPPKRISVPVNVSLRVPIQHVCHAMTQKIIYELDSRALTTGLSLGPLTGLSASRTKEMFCFSQLYNPCYYV